MVRRVSTWRWRWAGGVVLALAWLLVATGQEYGYDDPVRVLVSSGVYAEEQADAGQAAFARHCAHCHGAELQGGFGPRLVPLDPFQFRDEPLATVYAFIRTQMPFDGPGSLDDDVYVAILAFILQRNGYPDGSEPLPADADTWAPLVLDEPPAQ